MESHNEWHAAATTLLPAQTHVWNHIFSFINSMSLKSAIDLNIPEIIHKHGNPMPLPLLISNLQIHPSKTPNIHRLMRLLTHSGFFSLQKLPESPSEEGYVLTNASTLLLRDHPFTLTPFLLSMLDPILLKPWHELAAWYQNDDSTPFETAHEGRAFWDFAWHEPRLYNYFNESLMSDSLLVTRVVIEKCKGVFEGLRSLVDVGGGTGTFAKGLAEAFPEIECTVFDSPYVVSGMKGSGNLKFLEGDMFEAIPPADAIMFKWVLHDWNDEKCLKALKKSKEALTSKGKEGKVVIIDMLVETEKGDHESVETQLLFDMVMMALLSGKERTEKEWADLFFSAGFTSYKITPLLGLRSLMEVYP